MAPAAIAPRRTKKTGTLHNPAKAGLHVHSVCADNACTWDPASIGFLRTCAGANPPCTVRRAGGGRLRHTMAAAMPGSMPDSSRWYEIANVAEISSPALLVYLDRVDDNIRDMIFLQ